MKLRKFGTHGPLVSALGPGCMGISEFYGPRNDEGSIATIRDAIKSGISFFDTADMYGIGHNKQLVGLAIKEKRNTFPSHTSLALKNVA